MVDSSYTCDQTLDMAHKLLDSPKIRIAFIQNQSILKYFRALEMHLDIFQVHLQYFKFSTNWPSLAVGLLATKNFTKKFTKNSNRFYSNFKCSSNISSQLKIGLGPGPAKMPPPDRLSTESAKPDELARFLPL